MSLVSLAFSGDNRIAVISASSTDAESLSQYNSITHCLYPGMSQDATKGLFSAQNNFSVHVGFVHIILYNCIS